MSNQGTVRLGDVCIKGSSNIKQSDLVNNNGDYPIYGASGFIKNVDFYTQDKPYIGVVKDGAGVGRVMKLPALSSVIGTMQYIIPNDDIDVSYLAYAMEHMNLSKYYMGAAIPHIYFKDYKNEKLPNHTSNEQAQIVHVLDLICNQITKRNEQLSKLDELIKSRFVEMFGDTFINPYNWQSLKIQEAVEVEPQNGLYKPQSDYVEDKSGVPILRIDGFYNGKVVDFQKLKRLMCTKEEFDKYRLIENDIVINRVNSLEYLGKCACISGLIEGTVFESNMMRMHFYDERFNPIYITFLLCSKYTYNQIIKHAKKAVNQASINQKDVLDINIYEPPIDLQNQFGDFVSKAEQQKSTVQKSIDKLETLKKSLMQEYFG